MAQLPTFAPVARGAEAASSGSKATIEDTSSSLTTPLIFADQSIDPLQTAINPGRFEHCKGGQVCGMTVATYILDDMLIMQHS